ncbi:MAG TPA: hypothetical protein VMD99_11815 [Terriglobales bacterium]|nr:hypothetical protein [Terriglobales bacterium]
MFAELMERRAKLIRQRDEAEIELAKMKQLIVSVFSMLPEDQQKPNQQAIDDMEAESAGLQDAIKLVFSTNPGAWLTVSDVRERLIDTGFDFRRYKANPLASIGTTVKRIAETGYIESKNVGSGTVYMRRGPNLPYSLVPINTPGDAWKRAVDKKKARDEMPRGRTVPPVPDK